MLKPPYLAVAVSIATMLALLSACGSADPFGQGRKEFRLALTATNSSSNPMDVSGTLPLISSEDGCNDADGSITVGAHCTGTLIVKHLCYYQQKSLFNATITNSSGTADGSDAKKTFYFQSKSTGGFSVTCDDTGCTSPDASATTR